MQLVDPDMEFQPPDFPTTVDYEYMGVSRTLEFLEASSIVVEHGMSSWASKVKKVRNSFYSDCRVYDFCCLSVFQ